MIKTCPEYEKLETLPQTTFCKLLNKKNGFKENLFDLIPSFVREIKKFKFILIIFFKPFKNIKNKAISLIRINLFNLLFQLIISILFIKKIL